MAYPAMVVLSGIEITDQGRTISNSQDKRQVEVELANGDIKKFKKAYKKKYSISWEWLPGDAALTYDSKGGRDVIHFIALASDPITCQIRYSDTNIETFIAYIENYSEDPIRRDFVSNTTFWNVKLDLREK